MTRDFILLMHSGSEASEDAPWAPYFESLRTRGAFDGGSAIGAGLAYRKDHDPKEISDGLSGYIRVRADSLKAASALLAGNPVYESGGVVEIRELPRD